MSGYGGVTRPVGPAARVFFPLDEEWDLGGSRFSLWLVEAVVRLGVWIPFEHVPKVLAYFTQVTLSVETARRITESAGGAQVALEDAEVAALNRDPQDSPAGPPVQQLSLDGAFVPLVGGEWAETKTVAIGTVQQTVTATEGQFERTDQLSYFSRLAAVDTFRDAAWGEIDRRGVERAGVVCAVNDGAGWIQGVVTTYRPDAVRILDFPHVVESLGAVVRASFGAGTAAASEWLGVPAHELKHGDPDRVLTAVQQVPVALAANPAEATTARAPALGYLAERRAQIAYASFRAAGYPIGSGSLESANKLVVEARLKGSGMHWARHNVNPLLALRGVVCSDRWETVWPAIWHALRQQCAAHRRALRRTRRSSPPPSPAPAPIAASTVPPEPSRPKKIVNGRPTPDHPWRKPFLFRHAKS